MTVSRNIFQVWKSTIKSDHDFSGKINTFSVKSTFLLKKLLKNWFHGISYCKKLCTYIFVLFSEIMLRMQIEFLWKLCYSWGSLRTSGLFSFKFKNLQKMQNSVVKSTCSRKPNDITSPSKFWWIQCTMLQKLSRWEVKAWLEFWSYHCHSDFTWNQILGNWNCQKCHFWHF